jgi:ATP adenylyltransferase
MDHLFSLHKNDYVRRKNLPNVDCILCAILDNHPEVASLLIRKTKHTALSVNLYPYNSGHLLLFPLRHLHDLRDLTKAEQSDMHALLHNTLDVLDSLYQPHGYNIGWNVGNFSGASIGHIHQHVIPRYQNEVGFIDIIGGARIQVEDPQQTLQRLREAFSRYDS